MTKKPQKKDDKKGLQEAIESITERFGEGAIMTLKVAIAVGAIKYPPVIELK